MMEDLSMLTFDDRDDFGRKPVAENIVKLVSNEALDISPLVIDGAWGVGKTEFCHKLVNLHQQIEPKHHVAYLDAFKVDVGDQPLAAILATILELVPADRVEEIRKKSLPVLRFSSRVLLKAASKWVLKQDIDEVADELEHELASASSSAIDTAVESLIHDHRNYEATVAALRESLERVAESYPITIYIDELDRCRPDFALSMLEAIKHVFDLPGVRFVLIANTHQLLASIRHRYGIEELAESYLKKFIKHYVRIPLTMQEGPRDFVDVSRYHFRQLITASPALKETFVHEAVMLELFDEFVSLERMSLRDVESFVRSLEIYQTLSSGFPSNLILGYGLIFAFGVFLADRHPDRIQALFVDATVHETLLEVLGRDVVRHPNEEPNEEMLEVLAAFVAIESNNSDLFIDGDSESSCLDHWVAVRNSYFRSSIRTPHGVLVRQVREVLQVMMLQKVKDE